MTEPTKTAAAEGAGTTVTIDMTKFIPKEDHEKSVKERDDALGGLKRELEDAQTRLLSPEYLDFLEAQKGRKKAPTAEELKELNLPPAAMALIESLNAEVRNAKTAIANIAAVLELQDVEKRYPDFEKFRPDVQKILEQPGNNLTIEQALIMAKGQKVTPDTTPAKPVKGSEKPGGTLVLSDGTERKFKNANEASQAAADEVWEKHGLTGDII